MCLLQHFIWYRTSIAWASKGLIAVLNRTLKLSFSDFSTASFNDSPAVSVATLCKGYFIVPDFWQKTHKSLSYGFVEPRLNILEDEGFLQAWPWRYFTLKPISGTSNIHFAGKTDSTVYATIHVCQVNLPLSALLIFLTNQDKSYPHNQPFHEQLI